MCTLRSSSSLLNTSSDKTCIQQSKLDHLIIPKSVVKPGRVVGSWCKASGLSTLHSPSPYIWLLGHLQRTLTACKVARRELVPCDLPYSVMQDFPFGHSKWSKPGLWIHLSVWYRTVLSSAQCCTSVLRALQQLDTKNHHVDSHPTGNTIYTRSDTQCQEEAPFSPHRQERPLPAVLSKVTDILGASAKQLSAQLSTTKISHVISTWRSGNWRLLKGTEQIRHSSQTADLEC